MHAFFTVGIVIREARTGEITAVVLVTPAALPCKNGKK